MRSIKEAGELRGKRVLVRVDFNVPILNGFITDDFRIQKTIPLIEYLIDSGAKIILISHFEGEGGTLKPVSDYLSKKFKIIFIDNYFPQTEVSVNEALNNNQIVLFENLRKYSEEKENNTQFAIHLSSYADIYVNEAFASSHRNHASIVGIPKYLPHYSGFVLEEEYKQLSKAFKPQRPFLFILGGAKFETKLPLVEKFLNIADTIFIGGALANDFFKANGFETGKSLLSQTNVDIASLDMDKIVLPTDVIVKKGETIEVKQSQGMLSDDFAIDVGPESVKKLCDLINESAFVLWNGPLGNYEMGFKDATSDVAKAIADSNAISIVGGGDTIASIADLHREKDFTFISTGGGAMLDFLAQGTLPGFEALNDK